VQYALLFHTTENALDARAPSEREAWFAEMIAWRKELEAAGVFRASLRLADRAATTCVRRDGPALLVTDGPFADTKEYLGGFTLLDCPDLDAALAWARRCPVVAIGTVEVRPQHPASG
jgi:hypothetical protein